MTVVLADGRVALVEMLMSVVKVPGLPLLESTLAFHGHMGRCARTVPGGILVLVGVEIVL